MKNEHKTSPPPNQACIHSPHTPSPRIVILRRKTVKLFFHNRFLWQQMLTSKKHSHNTQETRSPWSECAPRDGMARPRPPLPSSALRKHTVNLRSRPHGHESFRSQLRKAAPRTACEARHRQASPPRQVDRAADTPHVPASAGARHRGARETKPAEGRQPGPPPPRPGASDDS